jgi:hypothetical protein
MAGEWIVAKIVATVNDPDRYWRTAAHAATKANGRQDKQDLQDGFCVGPAGAMHSFQLNPVSSSILPIRFILSKNQASI